MNNFADRVYQVYIHLTHWIEDRMNREQVEHAYKALGSNGFMRVSVSEVVKAMMLAHQNLHHFIREQGIFDAAVELHQLVELDDSVIDRFFDT